ncbi:MAG: ABC-F family ATP-binding cassette domain-containing protein [Verrucomicrobiales bacterium]|nr:ABC-F family ATP-binding cassette domain-containing protein [Verrucomicrobiales bacterium]
MLTVAGMSKAYGGRTLFADASLRIERGERLGLVGPNGAGKSTLFSLILGAEEADAGTVELERGGRVGHLPQENVPVGDETVMELATAITPEVAALRERLRAAEKGAMLGDDFHELQHRFEALGGYTLEARAAPILAGLGFRQGDFQRPARTLSGGWVMRAHLARLLVHEPDLLLLDEPTNHLDLESLLWFQDYLRNYPGAVLAISHDREFLNTLMGAIVEIRQARLWHYRGNYDAFLEQREANETQQLAAWKNQQREINRLQTWVDRFRAKNTKATQAQSKLKQIERMDKIDAPVEAGPGIDFRFPQPERSGQRAIELKHVAHAYGDLPVYDDLNFEAERGQRIVLVGPNGAGKSTLLKLLAGVLPVQHGERLPGHKVKWGYYSQYRIEMLRPDSTVLEEALDTPQAVTEQFVRTVLGSFLFRGDDVFKPVRVLSGGEKSRLALVKLLLDPPNLLLMDEPTTHLDLSSVDALIAALDQFEGTLIFISHDVHFIRHLGNHVVEVRDGRLRHFPGGYDYYVEKTRAEKAAAAPRQPAANRPAGIPPLTGKAATREERRRRAEEIRERNRHKRQLEEKVQTAESRIHTLETRQGEITQLLEDPATYEDSARAMALSDELKAVLAELEALHEAWEEAATKLSELELATLDSA